MLHRPASTPMWSVRRLTANTGVLAGPLAGLLRYVLVAAVLCAIGCVYLWQVNELSNIHDRTIALTAEARKLEQKNVVLSVQLAQWNSPAYVEKLSSQQGYVAAPLQSVESPSVASVAASQSTAP